MRYINAVQLQFNDWCLILYIWGMLHIMSIRITCFLSINNSEPQNTYIPNELYRAGSGKQIHHNLQSDFAMLQNQVVKHQGNVRQMKEKLNRLT